MQRQGSVIPVVNPAIASTIFHNKIVQRYDNTGANMNNEILHNKLKGELVEILDNIKSNMIARFAVMLPYDEMQDLLMSEATCNIMQIAGGKMGKQYTSYEYKLGEKVTIRLSCRGGVKMPAILFPNEELTIFSEDFLDLVRPLYSITKSWIDVRLAFEAVCKLIQDTRELNFYVPWLRLIFPQEKDLTNEFNAPYRVSNWLNLGNEKHSTIMMITRQIRYILNNEHTSKRTWMPSELVHMVRQGEELIAQYNMMKTVCVPDTYLREDQVFLDVVITSMNHPTIKWGAEAHTHRTQKEVERLKELDEQRAK